MSRERKGAVIKRGSKLFARVRFVDETGKVRSRERKAKNVTDAREILRTWLGELKKGGSRSVLSEKTSFTVLAQEYASRKLIPAEYHVSGGRVTKVAGLRSLEGPRHYLGNLIGHFASTPVRAVTHSAIEDYKLMRLRTPTIRGGQRSISSVNRELELLRAMFRFAAREGMINASPFNAGDPLISKADEAHRERVLSFEEEKRLLDACESPNKRVGSRRTTLKAIILVALDTGLRRGELLKLKWSDIDFGQRQIRILAFNSKTAKSRVVGMTPRVVESLALLAESPLGHADGLVFGITNNFKTSFAGACRDASIKGLTFHDLRHTAITRMVQSGVSVPEVMKISGHSQMKTFTRYVNPDTTAFQSIADRLAAFNHLHSPSVIESDSQAVN